MAELTRITTVEFTRVFKDSSEETDIKGYCNVLESNLRYASGNAYDDIKVVKVQQFVFPDQPKAPKLTKRERAFCELVGDGWIARDECGTIIWYDNKPCKRDIEWFAYGEYFNLDIFNEIPFMFIEWEDDEPWAVEDLLKLEVKE